MWGGLGRAVIALAFFAIAVGAGAQDTTPKPADTAAVQTVPLPPGNGEVIYLRDANGKPVPVAASATLKKFLKWLEEQNVEPGAAVPEYGISGVSVEGSADDDRARLTVRLKVQIHHDRWVKVPLGLSEAYLLPDHRYEGPGEQQAGELDPKSGYTWFLKGRGEHVLSLPVIVPLRKVPFSRRVFLSLPATAVSSLKLALPQTAAVTPAMDRATLQVQVKERGTDVEAFGLGERLDISWQPQPNAAPATVSLETNTSLLATVLDGQTLSLDATLTVRALRGNLDQLRIQLPSGFTAAESQTQLRVDGEEASGIRTDEADKQTLIVPLKSATAGPIVVKWLGTQRLPAAGPVVIEGPRIDRTDLHSGFLAVTVVGDYVARPVLEADPTVERITPSSLPPSLPETHVTAAYRILRQPFRLPLTLQKVDPFASVEPQSWLHAPGASLDLDMSWKVQVHRGSITTLRIDWPDREAHGWSVEPVEPAALIESVEEDPQGLSLRLVEPTSGPFTIRLRARRPIGTEMPLPVSIPELSGHRSTATEVLLTTADNLQSEVTGENGATLAPLSAAVPRRAFPAEAQKFASSLFRFEPGAARLTLALQPHQREITGKSVVRVNAGRGRLNITQLFQLNVKYERLAKLRFPLPAQLAGDQVRFFLGNAELVPSIVRDMGEPMLAVSLDTPRLGPIEIEARYRLADPLADPGTSSAQVKLPLLRVAEVSLSETRLEWLGSAYTLDVVTSGWLRQAAGETAVAWNGPGSPTSVDLKLVPSANPSSRGAVASRMLLTTRIGSDGRSLHTARYRVSGLIPNLRWTLPAEAEPTLQVWWNNGPVTPTRRVEGGELVCELSGLEVPSGLGGDERLLTMTWQQTDAELQRLGDTRRLAAPRMENLAVVESLWDVEIAPSHVLFQDPPGFDPTHTWKFAGYAWWRTPKHSLRDLSNWIHAEDGPPLEVSTGWGNRYQFARLGAPGVLSLWTMTGSGIVLLGTGAFAAVGLILLQSSRTRNLVTVLAGAVLLAAVGVAFPSTALVLLQPAAVGVLLALVGSFAQHLLRRRRPDPLSVASVSSYPIPPGSSIRQPIPVIGSDENTLIRPPSKDKTPVPADSGSRA